MNVAGRDGLAFLDGEAMILPEISGVDQHFLAPT